MVRCFAHWGHSLLNDVISPQKRGFATSATIISSHITCTSIIFLFNSQLEARASYLCSERSALPLLRVDLEHNPPVKYVFKSLLFFIVHHIEKSILGDQHLGSKAGASRRPNLRRRHRCLLRRIHQLSSVTSTRVLVPPAATAPRTVFVLRHIPLLVVSAQCSIPRGPKGKEA